MHAYQDFFLPPPHVPVTVSRKISPYKRCSIAPAPRLYPHPLPLTNPGRNRTAFRQTYYSSNRMVQLYLTPYRCLIEYYDDPGILQKPAQPGKEGGTRNESKIQCIIVPAPGFSPPGDIPGSCHLTGNRRGDAHGHAVPSNQRPFSGLFPLYFFP